MRTLLLMTIFVFSASAFAGLYKWTDNEGNVHYSQKPPKNQQFKRLKAPPPAPANAKPLYPSQSTNNSKTGNTGKTTKETEKAKILKAENCAKARKNLSNYQVHRRIKDKDGNVKIISDDDRAAKIANANKDVEHYCN